MEYDSNFDRCRSYCSSRYHRKESALDFSVKSSRVEVDEKEVAIREELPETTVAAAVSQAVTH